MKNSLFFRIGIPSLFLIILAQTGFSATVTTIHGEHTGRVIARKFDNVVITILTTDKRIFQFSEKDVLNITDDQKLLVGKPTTLQEIASASSEKVVDLVPGLEVKVLDTPKDSDWIHVQVWGSTQGWIPKSVLTGKIVFSNNKELPQTQPVQQEVKSESPVDVPSGKDE